jgi:hypothetical protein
MSVLDSTNPYDRLRPFPDRPGYLVSVNGDTYSCWHPSSKGARLGKRWHRLKTCLRKDGYVAVSLGGGNKWLVHRLVLFVFVGPCPEGMEACHNNGDRADNRLENLRYDTHSANQGDSIRLGTFAQMGERHRNAKLTTADVLLMRELRAQGWTYPQIGERFGVEKMTAWSAVNGRNWKHVTRGD